MKTNRIYMDINGNRYVKGNLGGGFTINMFIKGIGWDYCSLDEQSILAMCKDTGVDIYGSGEERNSFHNVVLANCIAYAFRQCVDSDVAITRVHMSDEDLVVDMRTLAMAYQSISKDLTNDEKASLYWTIEDDTIDKVLNTENLEDYIR